MDDSYIISEAIRLVDEGICVTYKVRGWSMLPFIVGDSDSVILQKSGELKVGDVVLAWADNCQYVIHRIIAVEGDRITLMGDGNLAKKEYCRAVDVKALVTHVVDARERRHDLNSSRMRRAARLWFHLRPVRRYLLFVVRLYLKLRKQYH